MIQCLGLLALLTAPQESTALFIEADRILVRPGEETSGAVLIQNGIIVAVGQGLTPPEGARQLRGEVVCAGYLDAWASLGVDEESANDRKTDLATRAVDGVDPYGEDHLLQDTLAAGVTSARVQAGTKAQYSGLGAVVRIHPDEDGASLVLLEDACVGASIGVTRGREPDDIFDRVEEVEKLTDEIDSGLDYRESWHDYEADLAEWEAKIAEEEEELEDDFKKAKKKREEELEEAEEEGEEFKEKRYKEDRKPRRPRYDAEKEIMARVGLGELPLVVEVHRHEELRALLAATERFGSLRLILAGASEAAPFAEELALRRIPVIVWPIPLDEARPDEYDAHRIELAAVLDDAGVRVLFGSGGSKASRDLPMLAALAVGHGMDRQAAFEALTLAPAVSFDLADRIGSVERGKEADLLVLTGDPLGVTTRVRFAILRGEVVVGDN